MEILLNEATRSGVGVDRQDGLPDAVMVARAPAAGKDWPAILI
ncbi:MAG: hypothetical protein ACOY3E_17265 [Pseudomonadota bacterium]